MPTETAFAKGFETLSPSCGAEKDEPAAYRENRHWTMFRSHRGRLRIHHEPQDLTVTGTERRVSQ